MSVGSWKDRSTDSIQISPSLFPISCLPECEGAPRVVLNVQPGADHFGPNHFDLALEEVIDSAALMA